MITIDRQTFKTDPVWGKLWEAIKLNHEVADYEAKTLWENRHTKDFCVESRHFRVLGGKKEIYIHYDTHTWFDPKGGRVKIVSIGIYDDFTEYMKAFGKDMNSTDNRQMNLPEN